MLWSLEVTTPPAFEPLTIDEVKEHCRIQTADEDAYLDRLIATARQLVEERTGKQLITTTRKLRLERWPIGDRIHLPGPPLQSITSIAYLDTSNVSQTLATTEYQVVGARTTPDADSPLALVQPAHGKSWPSTYDVPEAITITFVCGWKSRGLVPERIRTAMLMLIADAYLQREPTITGTIIARLPQADEYLANETCYELETVYARWYES